MDNKQLSEPVAYGEPSETENKRRIKQWITILPGVLFVAGLVCFIFPFLSILRNMLFIATLLIIIGTGIYRAAESLKK